MQERENRHGSGIEAKNESKLCHLQRTRLGTGFKMMMMMITIAIHYVLR